MHTAEERCAHGAAETHEQLGIHVGEGEQRRYLRRFPPRLVSQPFPVVAARLQTRLQETPRVEIFVPVAVHRISFR